MPSPRLSIVVPLLNEALNLPPLLADLARQQGIEVELLLCDGGSTDGSAQLAEQLIPTLPFPARWLSAPRGRAPQMNAGAAAAKGEYLLFLHADCRFPEADALAEGINALAAEGERAAGHFALRFARDDETPSFPYYFYACKARLNRPGCIHGDQGMLLRRSFFQELGGFDATLPVLEDDRLAARIFAAGAWLLLPREIVTSARRFESEGLYARQLLNALLCACAACGWEAFFDAAGDLYRCQDRTGRLDPGAYLALVDRMLNELPGRERRRIWWESAGYVRGQAWQLALLLDLRRNWKRGLPPGSGAFSHLARHERWFDRLADHAGGRLAALLLTWGWFRLARWYHRA